MTEAYCVKCKRKVEIVEPIADKTKRGVNMTRGKCPDCSIKVCRIGSIK